MLTPLPTQDYTVLARKYVRLAEDPANVLYREQFLDLARVWMEVAMEEESNDPLPQLPLEIALGHFSLGRASGPSVIALLKLNFSPQQSCHYRLT
jgi:hypothetical protein